MMAYKKSIYLDFDGVLAEYTGWQDPEHTGPPLESARHACHILARDFKLVCFTARENLEPVERWLRAHGFPKMEVTSVKKPFALTIDDRALRFTGKWTDEFLAEVKAFKPYWEKL